MQGKIFKRALAMVLSLSLLMLSVFTGITVTAEDAAVYEADRITIHPGIDETRFNFSWHSDLQASPASVRIKVTGTEDWIVFTGESKAVKTSESGHQDGYHDTFVKNCGHTCSDICGHPACSSTQCYHGTYAKPYYNRVTVSGLEFGKEYTYQLGDGTAWSKEYTTKTADADPDKGFEYLVFGDSQTADQYYGDYMKKALELATDIFPEADFMMNLGDNIHENNDRNYNAYFTSQDILTQFPIAVVMGNHELNIGALENHPALTFTNPPAADARQDYWFRYGDALFITFNSGPQKTSMMEDLDNLIKDAIAAHPDARWKILQTHQGFYSNNGGGKVWRREFVPVISKYDIDMVFVGHHHMYTRTESMIYDSALTCTHEKGEPVFDCSACSGYIEELGEKDVTVDEVFVATDGTETQYKKTTERTDPKGITYMHLDSLTAEGHDQYYTGSSSLAPTSAYSVNTISGQGAISKVTVTEDALKVETYWINNNGTPRIGNNADIALLDDDYINEQPYDSYTIHKTSEIKEVEVTFDGGSDRGIFTRRINAGETVAEPENPVLKGKSFKYWTLDGETEFDFTTVLNESITLTAVYEDIPPITTAALFVEAVKRGDSEIVLASDITLTDEDIITIGNGTVIKSKEGQQYTLTLDGSTRLATATSSKVTFENINITLASTIDTMTSGYNSGGYIKVGNENAKLYINNCNIHCEATSLGASDVAIIRPAANTYCKVYIENSKITSNTANEKGSLFGGTNAVFRAVDSTLYPKTSSTWLCTSTTMVFEGNTLYRGWKASGYKLYDFSNTSVKAARNPENLIELSKIGSGAAATNDNYKIYYSLDETAFDNGTAIEYTEPIADVDFATPIYVAIRYTGTSYYSAFAEKYCGEYIEGVAVATADAFVTAVENGESVITLTSDITLNDSGELTIIADTVIKSKSDGQYTITLDGSSRLTVAAGKTAKLENINIVIASTANTIADSYNDGSYITVGSSGSRANLYIYNCKIEGKSTNLGASVTSLITSSKNASSYVYIEGSTITSVVTGNNGALLGGYATYRIVDSTLNAKTSSAWFCTSGTIIILEGTSSYRGWKHNSAKLYNFSNTSVKAARNPENLIELSKIGSGAAATNDNYKIYYSLDETAFNNGTAIEYTEPIADVDFVTPIYVAIRYADTSYYSTPAEKYCGEYVEGIAVATADAFVDAIAGGESIITLTDDITLADLGNISIGADTVIQSKPDEQFTIILDGSSRLTVATGKTVVFNGINVIIAENADKITDEEATGNNAYYYGYITVHNGAKLYVYDCNIESKSTDLGSAQTAIIKIYREDPTNGYVHIENSTIVSPSGKNKGVALGAITWTANTKPTFRLIDSTITGNWVFYQGHYILEGTVNIEGVGYSSATATYDFRNSSLAGIRNLSDKIKLSKIGLGAAVTNENYKIYYSTNEDAFTNGTAIEYTAPIEEIDVDTPIYVAIGYTNGSYLCYSTPVECAINLLGDVDNDGVLNASDLVPLRKYLLGLDTSDMSIADLNEDSVINLKDLVCLKKSIAGIN